MSEVYQKGLQIRKEVLGAEYVENALASATSFNQPLQDLVTEYCWGAVWGRDGLTRKTRSMLNIALTAAMGQHNELRIHVRAAIGNGVTADEISEILLHISVYAGVPAAVDAFGIAKVELEAIGEL